MRKATRMLLAVILALFGMLTPLTAQAATVYRIGQVGDAWFQSVTDANGNDLVGATVDANGQYFDMTVGIRIDRMETLHEGDVVDVEFATSGHYSWWFFGVNGGVAASSIAGSDGRMLFAARNSGNHLYLTRTGEPALGRLEASVSFHSQYWSADLQHDSTVWQIVDTGAKVTFSNRKIVIRPCTSGTGGFGGYGSEDMASNGNRLLMQVWIRNCATVYQIANGKPVTTPSGDMVAWLHLTRELGGGLRNVHIESRQGLVAPYDEKTPGDKDIRITYDYPLKTIGTDVSTFDRAETNLKPGERAVMVDGDDYYMAMNMGSRNGDDHTLRPTLHNDADEVSRAYYANARGVWDVAQPQLFADFTDLTVPNRYRVEWAVSADGTRTGAFTYRYNPPDPSLGSSQSGIRYEPNGGQGDAYLTVGDPDTTVAAAPAGTFTGTGLTFVGWNTERDGSGRTVMPDDMIAYPKEGSILTLYAQWKRIPETVLPDTGGHAGTPTRILAGGGLPYSADSSSHHLRNAGDAIWSDPHHARHGKEGVTCAV
ncbi:InlB B-repeat-containing protein [Bifidobacterium faecale]|uniref:InlB B-repeat-containing protein n=1 Tax=Bifidobacterium adolescentis TaxID=1680 RepID=UPI001659BCC2|nr:InlB B-repeat-containing protein [Bifidobacterium faecale]